MPAQQVGQSLAELFTLTDQVATTNECGDDLALIETTLEENLTAAQRAVVNELIARIASELVTWVSPGDDSFWHTMFAPSAAADESEDENENGNKDHSQSEQETQKGTVGKCLSRHRLLLHAVIGMCLKHATSSPVQGVWPAARLYLSILSIPGALSYRMYVSELFQTTLRTLNGAQHPPETMAKGIANSLRRLMECLSGAIEQDLRAHRSMEDDLFRSVLAVSTWPTCSRSTAESLGKALIAFAARSNKTSSLVHGLLPLIAETGNTAKSSSSSSRGTWLLGLLHNALVSAAHQQESSNSPELNVAPPPVVETDDDDDDDEVDNLSEKMSKMPPPRSRRASLGGMSADGGNEDVHNNNAELSMLGLAFLQHHFMQALSENADRRHAATATSLSILSTSVPENQRFATCLRFFQFLSKATRSVKPLQRQGAVEWASALLCVSLEDHEQYGFLNSAEWTGARRQTVFDSIAQRCLDKVPTVRSSALKAVGDVMGAFPKRLDDQGGAELLCATSLSQTLALALNDDKPTVRRSALRAIQKLAHVFQAQNQIVGSESAVDRDGESGDEDMGDGMDEDDDGHSSRRAKQRDAEEDAKSMETIVSSVAARQTDVSLSVRRGVLDALTAWLTDPPIDTPAFHSLVSNAWLGAMLELVDDRERSLESRVLDLLRDRILLPLIDRKSGGGSASSKHNDLVWLAFAETSTGDIDRFGQAILRLSQVHDLNVKKLVPAMETIIRDTEWRVTNDSVTNAIVSPGRKANNAAVADDHMTKARIERGKLVVSWSILDMLCGGSHLSEKERSGNGAPQVHDIRHNLHKLRDSAIKRVNTELILKVWDDTLEHMHQQTSESNTIKQSPLTPFVHQHVTNVLIGIAPLIEASDAQPLAEELLSTISDLSEKPDVCALYVRLLVSLCRAKTSDEATSAEIMRVWVRDLLFKCTAVLKHYIVRGIDGDLSVREESQKEGVGRALHLVGELVSIGFDPNEKTQTTVAKPTAELVTTVEALTSPHFVTLEDLSDEEENDVSINDDIAATTSTIISSIIKPEVSPGTTAATAGAAAVAAVALTISRRTRGERLHNLPGSVRAHALITVGKLCICDSSVAKTFVPALVHALERSTDGTIKTNVLIILGDLCRRYTNIVDAHIGAMAGCLHDPTPTVRKHALVTLVGLLQEDYLKWKGLLLFRMLSCAVDDDIEVRDVARYALVDIFLKRSATLFHTNFVETLFVLSNYRGHPRHNQMARGREHGEAHMPTPPPDTRLAVYKFLLENMTDHQRLEAASKLQRDVVGAMLDGVIPVDGLDNHIDVLVCDTFAALGLANMRVRGNAKAGGSGPRSAVTGDEMDTPHASSNRRASMESSYSAATTATSASGVTNMSGSALSRADALASAKGKVLAKLQRKNIVENVVPASISLYRMLQRSKSPLLRHLIPYLRLLVTNHSDELNDALAGDDREIVDELRYDMRLETTMKQRRRRLSGNHTRAMSIGAVSPQETAAASPMAPPGSIRRTVSGPAVTPRRAAEQRTPMRSGRLSSRGRARTTAMKLAARSPGGLMSPMVANALDSVHRLSLGQESVPRLRRTRANSTGAETPNTKPRKKVRLSLSGRKTERPALSFCAN